MNAPAPNGHQVTLGEQIMLERRRRRITQRQLAHRTGLSATYLSDLERGNRGIGVLNMQKILLALGGLDFNMLNGLDLTARSKQ